MCNNIMTGILYSQLFCYSNQIKSDGKLIENRFLSPLILIASLTTNIVHMESKNLKLLLKQSEKLIFSIKVTVEVYCSTVEIKVSYITICPWCHLKRFYCIIVPSIKSIFNSSKVMLKVKTDNRQTKRQDKSNMVFIHVFILWKISPTNIACISNADTKVKRKRKRGPFRKQLLVP